MLRNITWSNYIIAVGAIIVIWYLCLIIRYHHKEIRQLFSGKLEIRFLSKGNKSTKDHVSDRESGSSFTESLSTREDAEELAEVLRNAIEESSERNLSKDEMKNYLRLILNDYPYVKISYLRQNINNIIVKELGKYPELLISLEEADSLWEEII